MSEWQKQPAIQGGPNGCLNCPPIPDKFPMEGRICVGFGWAALTKDGECIWMETDQEYNDCMSGAEAEEIAAKDPDHDWRIEIEGPLSGRTFQRHDAGEWLLIGRSQGFA